MPELPEVQTIIHDLLKAGILHKKIQKMHVFWKKTLAIPDEVTFSSLLEGQFFTSLTRRGKFIVFQLSNGYYLLIHLRMTGRLLLVDHETPLTPYIRVVLELNSNKMLYYHDTRKFGRWYLVQDPQHIVQKLGPEPLEEAFSLQAFQLLIKNKKRALKPLLLDQTFLAGLGNIYVDEALWEAKLHPLRLASTLDEKEIERLHLAIVFVLQRGIASEGTTLGTGKTNYYRLDGQKGKHQTLLSVFRKTGKPCPRCGTLIERCVVAQRSTHICPACQKLTHEAF